MCNTDRALYDKMTWNLNIMLVKSEKKIYNQNMNYYVYILTNKNKNVLYTGVTNNLERRTNEHRYKIDKSGFAEKYNCDYLVYYQETTDIYQAITREKQIKNMSRQKKIDLINEFNPEWKDLL